MYDPEEILHTNLNKEQEEACKTLSNLILTACPGSGKTRTVSYRIAYLKQQYRESRRLHVAITYTNRAADEVISRLEELNVDSENVWVGTIHQFCMKFIIRPYSMYSSRLKKGYHIIDEYVKNEYGRDIASDLGINIWNPFDNRKVVSEYKKVLLKNKEIDFDDILIISKEILSTMDFVAENIAATIASIQIDEYQDTNEAQYDILAAIYKKRPDIIISFIGDVNQAIYGSLGGVAKTPDELKNLFKTNFVEKKLTKCYRSVQKVIDYYCNFEVREAQIQSAKIKHKSDGVVCWLNQLDKNKLSEFIAAIINKCLKSGVSEEEICVLAPQWGLIMPVANKLRKLLPDNNFDAPDVSPFKYDPMNPFYLLAKLTFTSPTKDLVRKRYANEIISIISSDFSVSIPSRYDTFHLLSAVNAVNKTKDEDGLDKYQEVVGNVFKSMRIEIDEEPKLKVVYEKFIQKTKSRIQRHNIPHSCQDCDTCFKEKRGIVINTIHGVKGEEYEVVIAFGLLKGYLPHWNDIINVETRHKVETSKRLLYVLGSRAKEQLYLISETGRVTNKGKAYLQTEELASLNYNYDTIDM